MLVSHESFLHLLHHPPPPQSPHISLLYIRCPSLQYKEIMQGRVGLWTAGIDQNSPLYGHGTDVPLCIQFSAGYIPSHRSVDQVQLRHKNTDARG